MGMLEDLLNAKARVEEFTPDIPFAIYANDPQDVVNYMTILKVTDPPQVPVYTLSALPEGVFFIETGSYLLVIDMLRQEAVQVDRTVYGKKATLGEKVVAAMTGHAKLTKGELG